MVTHKIGLMATKRMGVIYRETENTSTYDYLCNLYFKTNVYNRNHITWKDIISLGVINIIIIVQLAFSTYRKIGVII